jgi:hypothetical protein
MELTLNEESILLNALSHAATKAQEDMLIIQHTPITLDRLEGIESLKRTLKERREHLAAILALSDKLKKHYGQV